MQAKALPGFRDFYPDITALRNHIFATWRTVAARYGFQEYDGPPLEPLELYTRKSGEEIVGQLYAFEDKGGRQVALRPEMTPTLARMVAARANGLKKPIRWFSLPQLFRYERQQRGRLREHFQLNVDVIGEPGPMADTEVIAVGIDIMRGFGLGPDDVQVRLSDRRVMRALLVDGCGVSETDLGHAYTLIDKAQRVPHETLIEHWAEQGRDSALAQSILTDAYLVGGDAVDARLEALGCADAGEDLRLCVRRLGELGFGKFVRVDTSIVRGLAYYTGIVFEFFDAQGALRAICGGGRYDGLLGALGGVDLPATGFGMGDVVLGELLKERGWAAEHTLRLDAFLIPVTSEDVAPVLALARELRDHGLRVEYPLKPQSIGKQLAVAADRPARCAVIVGPDERKAGEGLVRLLADGSERRVPLQADTIAAACGPA